MSRSFYFAAILATLTNSEYVLKEERSAAPVILCDDEYSSIDFKGLNKIVTSNEISMQRRNQFGNAESSSEIPADTTSSPKNIKKKKRTVTPQITSSIPSSVPTEPPRTRKTKKKKRTVTQIPSSIPSSVPTEPPRSRKTKKKKRTVTPRIPSSLPTYEPSQSIIPTAKPSLIPTDKPTSQPVETFEQRTVIEFPIFGSCANNDVTDMVLSEFSEILNQQFAEIVGGLPKRAFTVVPVFVEDRCDTTSTGSPNTAETEFLILVEVTQTSSEENELIPIAEVAQTISDNKNTVEQKIQAEIGETRVIPQSSITRRQPSPTIIFCVDKYFLYETQK